MDPCTAAVICKMEEELNVLALTDFFCESVDELKILCELKNETKDNNTERIAELYRDIFELRDVIEKAYEKKYGVKLVWSPKRSS